jgi:hypothetical protein
MANFAPKSFTPGNKAPEAPTTPPVATPAAAPETAPVAQNEAPKASDEASKKERSPRITYTPEMLKTVIEYSNSVSTKDLAEQLGINPIQVNAIRKKIQKSLRDKLAKKLGVALETLYDVIAPKNEGDKPEIDFSKPLHEEAQKLENKIDEKFTKERAAKKTTSASKANIDKLVDDWLNDL